MRFLKHISLISIILYGMLAVTSISISIVGFLWINQRVSQFKLEAENSRDDFVKEQKTIIREQVEKAVTYVDYMKSTTNARLRESIRSRVYEAHNIATNLYRQNKGSLSDAQIQKLIKDALRPIRFNNDRGYFFATRLDGIEILFADRPEMEGMSMLNTLDTRGKYVIKDMIELAKTQKEGFYSYTWTMPGRTDGNFKKTAYIKHFAPYDWFIGTGEYVEDVKNDIQQEALQWLTNVRFSGDGYLFGSLFNGDPLFTGGKVTLGSDNIWDLTDPNGIKVIQEQKKAAIKPEGDYYEYAWIKLNDQTPSPKISFSKSIQEWGWMIGAGVYTDNIDTLIATRKESLTMSIRKDVVKIMLVLIGLFIIVFVFARMISSQARLGFDRFTSFFESATTTLAQISLDDVRFSEFSRLVEIANKMVEARLRTEAALTESEQKYRNVVENTSEAICVIQDQRLKYLNPATADLLGYSLDEVPQTRIPEFIHPDDKKRLFSEVEKWFALSEKVGDFSFRIMKKDGECRNVYAKMALISWSEQPAVLAFLTDMTYQIRSNEMMIQYEKIMSLGELAAGMAHEINNPLGGMILGIQGIERRLDPKSPANQEVAKQTGADLNTFQSYIENRKISSLIQGVKDSGKKASHIVSSMLQFSRKSGSELAACNLDTIVDTVLELAGKDYDLKKKYDFRAIQIEKDIDPQLPPVFCVKTEIEQVLLNLVKNAAHAFATNPDSKNQKLMIRLSQVEDQAQIEIEDNGPGLDEKTQKRIFEPFFTTKPVGEGTGLGLSVSYMIITNNHGGTIEVESEFGKGTRFIIRLPIQNQTT